MLIGGDLFGRIEIANAPKARKCWLDTIIRVGLLGVGDWFLTPPSRRQVQQLHTLLVGAQDIIGDLLLSIATPNGATGGTRRSSPTSMADRIIANAGRSFHLRGVGARALFNHID